MSGNVGEWCLDEYYSPQRTDLSEPARRVVRGGSWNLGRGVAHASSRYYSAPEHRNNPTPGLRGPNVGLRVVRSSPSLA